MPNKGTRPGAMDAAEGSIVVKAPVADVYKRWLAFEDYPKFITAIQRVRRLDENHFVASLSDQSTCVTLKLTSSFGGAVSRRVDRYLQNFKKLVEGNGS